MGYDGCYTYSTPFRAWQFSRCWPLFPRCLCERKAFSSIHCNPLNKTTPAPLDLSIFPSPFFSRFSLDNFSLSLFPTLIGTLRLTLLLFCNEWFSRPRLLPPDLASSEELCISHEQASTPRRRTFLRVSSEAIIFFFFNWRARRIVWREKNGWVKKKKVNFGESFLQYAQVVVTVYSQTYG